jgi:hypothetical protein
MPKSVAARSKAWVCGRSSAAIVGSNPAGGMEVCLPGRCLCDGPITRSRVLPTVACLSVIAKPQKQIGTGSLGAN